MSDQPPATSLQQEQCRGVGAALAALLRKAEGGMRKAFLLVTGDWRLETS